MLRLENAPEWREDLRDDETRLPLNLYPFSIGREYIGHHRTDRWQVDRQDEKGLPVKALSTHPDIWSAFRAMTDAYEAWYAKRPIDQVYFIGSELRRGALVKIGFSCQPQARLRALQTASGERLQIFATVPGGRLLEEKYHRRWRARRQSGEWFTLGDCILAEIARLNTGAVA